jgi:hypothetical protein
MAGHGVKGQGASMQDGHLGSILAAIGIFVGIVSATIGMAILGVPWWGYSAFFVWGLLWLVAGLGLSDEASRKFLAGTLRKSTFTQIYTTLARRNVMGIWNRLCDPAPKDASLPAFFRAALTWRLHDVALRLAVAYPLLLLVGQWVATGAEVRVGSFAILPAADFWPERAVVLLIALILTGSVVGRKRASASQRPTVKKVAINLLFIAVLAAVAVAVAVAGSVALAFAVAAAAAFAGAGAFAVAFAFALPFAFAFTFASEGACAGACDVAGTVALAFAAGVLAAVLVLDRRGKQRLAQLLPTGVLSCAVVIAAITLDWSEVSEDRRSLFLFFAVLPLINALFDVASYALTLSLIRRGLRSGLPFLWGLADLGLASVLLLGLGATLVAVIHGLNLAAGVPFLDLPALFEGVQDDPGAYVWLYLMLFSTLLPTLLHGALSLLGLQGIWPLGLRRPVAGWVAAAPASPLHAIRASLGLSLIWALPLLGLAGVLWGIWHYAQPLLVDGLQLYLKGLLWIATHPVGAI